MCVLWERVGVFTMDIFSLKLLIFGILSLCESSSDIWHSYRYDPNHQSREELVISNFISNDQLKLEYQVTKWRSLRVEETCYVAGLMERNVVIASIKLNNHRNGVNQESQVIELQERPVDVALFQHWNSSLKEFDVIAVVATQKSELLWFRIEETKNVHFWTWPIQKNISHFNIFQIEYNYHILIISEFSSKTTADMYEFELNEEPNFWLRQKIDLNDTSKTSAIANVGPHYYLAIPQTSLKSLVVYKLTDKRFILHKNLNSRGIDDVVSFKMGHKTFIAFNGFNAGIYKFVKDDLVKEKIVNSHLYSVNFWLPISFSRRDETVLIAQRSLDHGLHKSFVIEVITYNGDKFEEHEDINCLYFGESVLGLSCLPGEESEDGIAGAAPISLDGVLGLLIPRNNSFSEFFIIESTLQKNRNPVRLQLENFIKQRQHFDNLMKEQEERYKKAIANTKQRSNFESKPNRLQEINEDINLMSEQLNTLSNPPHFTTVVFNGVVEIQDDGKFEKVTVEKISEEPADTIFNDIVLKHNIDEIPSPKIFNRLEVEDLNFEQVNQIDAKNLLFRHNNLTINNDLFLEKPLLVENVTSEEVNGISFETDIIDFDSPIDELVFENIDILGDVSVNKLNDFPLSIVAEDAKLDRDAMELESLFMPHNIQVENVNNENFNEFLRQLCLRNIKYYLPGITKIKGDVTIKEDARTEYLNNLKFPQEYVFTDNNLPNITGSKIFSDTLTASDINCEGTVNDILSSKIITISTDQNVTGTTTFKNLKVTEKLDVGGKVLGEHANKFLPNPTLLETDFIKANVNFKNLEVEGSIILSENYNGKSFEATLSDIVYSDEENVVIEEMKQFLEGFAVEKNLEITSNMINNVNLNSVITKNTDQILNITNLRGIVTFGNVVATGLYDSVDVKKLDDHLVKLDGEQYISSTLIFENDLEVNELEIFHTINDLSEDNFLYTNRNEQFSESGNFDTLDIDSIILDGSFFGNIENFDLEDFNRRHFSFSKDQIVEASYKIHESIVENMDIVQINDIHIFEYSENNFLEKLKKKLLDGELDITNLHVADSIKLNKINNQTVINLGGSLWKSGGTNSNLTSIYFNDDVYFNSVQIEKLSGVSFNKYLDNVVFKNEPNPRIKGCKTFEALHVEKLVETEKLNNIYISDILTKQGSQEILGPLTINGKVSFDNDITIFENINNIPIKLLTEGYHVNNNDYTVKGDVLFNRLPHIRNLQLEGYVNDRLVQQVIDGIIYKNTDFKLQRETSFENNVSIDGNIRVLENTNGLDLTAYVSNMIMITKDTEIRSPVRFIEPVNLENRMTVLKDLNVETVNNEYPEDWVEKGVFVDRGYLEGSYIFEDVHIVDNLHTDYINDINLQTLIPLRHQQYVPELCFEEITLVSDIAVGNFTNSHNLPEEFSNTVLNTLDEDIDSDVHFFNNAFIEGDMKLLGSLNQMQTNKIVTTNTDQNLSAIYNFKSKLILEKNLIVQELINGINMTKWMIDSVRTLSFYPENVTDRWLIHQDMVIDDVADGKGLINGLDFQKFSQEVEDKRRYKYAVEKGSIDDYTNICKDLTYMYHKLQKQIYKFNYLENLQVLDFQNKIHYVYHFEQSGTLYLLVNEEKRCETHLFVFDSYFRFIKSVSFGYIHQIVAVHDNDLIYLVIHNEDIHSPCEIQGTNIWKLTDSDLFVNVLNLENQEVLQESLIPGTFYGIKKHVVTEFQILSANGPTLRKIRKWEVREENMAFLPRGLGTGLALRTGRKLIRLNRDDSFVEDFSYETESVIRGSFTEEINMFVPGRKEGDLVVMKVGMRSSKRSLLAVASHEETSVKGSLDFVKVYEDVLTGKVFHKVATYKPSTLVSLEFNNGETLLAFMEDENVLQVYEYKGIEGFKHKLSTKLEGSKLFKMSVQVNGNERKMIGVIDKKRITFIEALMLGNQIEDNLQCSL